MNTQTRAVPDGVGAYSPRVAWACLLAGLAALLALHHEVLLGMVQDWSRDENNSHGWLIPFISISLLWTKREVLRQTRPEVRGLGLGLVALGLLLLCLGHFSTELFTQRSSFVIILAGLVWCFMGDAVFGLSWTAVAYLLFMVPIPAIVMDAIALPLKLLVTAISVETLRLLGVMVVREGNVMMFPSITLEVVNACSGLRSIVSMFAIGTAMALLLEPRLRNRLILVALALPIAMLTNIIRVVCTGLLAQYIGAAAAEGFFHEFAGLAVFGAALALFFLAMKLLRRVAP